MPFQSEKQRRYLHANEPEVAKKWEAEQKAQSNALRKTPATNTGGASIGGGSAAAGGGG
jgi:hypothetical protein